MALTQEVALLLWQFELGGGSAAGGDDAEFGVWYEIPAGTPSGDLDDALLDFATAGYTGWGTSFDPTDFATSVALVSTEGRLYDSALHTTHVQKYLPGSSWVGSASGSLPWQVSMAIGLYSYTPGTFIPQARRRRGRIYLPPFASGKQNVPLKGTLDNTQVDGFLAQANDMVSEAATTEVWGASGTTGCTPGVLSRAAQHHYALTDLASDGVLDSQRRRTHQESRDRRSIPWTV